MRLIIHFIKNPISLLWCLLLGGRYRYSLKNLLRHHIAKASDIAKKIVKENSLEINFDYKGQKIFMRNEIGAVYYMTEGIKKLDKLVSRIELSENATVIDVGGNIGLFSLFLLQKFPNTRIILLEPSSKLQGILEKNLANFRQNINNCSKSFDGTKRHG